MTPSGSPDLGPNAQRFSGFAGLYDQVRPHPPETLSEILTTYCGRSSPAVVDLGSGTGLSTRWAAVWAGSVIGVEPSTDMLATADAQKVPNTRFVAGYAHRTGLDDSRADVVLAVQSFHWMKPSDTLAEVERILRPGGVFAAIDCDWPPTVGYARSNGPGWSADKSWRSTRHAWLVGSRAPRCTRRSGPTTPSLADTRAGTPIATVLWRRR
jgi:ubiquinone/menaquinone biosynthesis C-methylase UbiE